MFRFEHIDHLYYLGIIPVLVGIFILTWMARTRAIERFGDLNLMQQLMPQMSKYKDILKFGLLMLTVAFIIIAWANPQQGLKKEKVKRKSVDVILALDVSTSMLAQDLNPNRMERAKQFAIKLIETLKGDRIGIVIFAGNAYLQMPLTTDYAAAQLFVKSANPELAPTQGTAISDAIDLAKRTFEENNKQHKALIVITDGENHEEGVLELAEQSAEDGLLIFTVGVGTANGGPIPVVVNGATDFKRDKTGNIVRSRLNEGMLKDIARAAKGAYFNLNAGNEIIEALRENIDKIEKREFEQRTFKEFDTKYQYFIALALLFLLIEFLISYRKSKWWKDRDLFEV